jgi:ElaB/YqjD/DUF883 family membrane-anchored ribosome-binding protein
MASRADNIEREIAERRSKLSSRADDLRWSARDLQNASQSMLKETPHALFDENMLKEQVEQRPLIAVGVALAAGVLLGAASESSLPKDAAKSIGGAARDGSGLVGELFGVIEGAAGAELRRFVSDMLGSRGTAAQTPTGARPEPVVPHV